MSAHTHRAKTPQEAAVAQLRVEVQGQPDRAVVAERVTVGSAERNDLQLDDREVSRFHLELKAGPGGVDVNDLGSTNGTWLGNARIHHATLHSGTAIRLGRTTLVVSGANPSSAPLAPNDALSGLRGQSVAMRRLMARVGAAAAATSPVLVTGESGTGKELVARALHDASPRASRPFEIVDCAALVPTLVGSELFGHERGAFSGADSRHVGAFERADGGTLFLDEIGELSPAIQPALLGALERRRIRRLGGKQDIPVDVRIVAATHRDLRSEVNAGRFRLDLYYRLAVVTLETPPLRERLEDLPILITHFLETLGRREPLEHFLSPAALRQIEARPFSGNVRELRNLVESMVAMGELPAASPESGADPSKDDASPLPPYKAARDAATTAFERSYLSTLFAQTGGNVSRAARIASMDRSHLIDLLHKHKLK